MFFLDDVYLDRATSIGLTSKYAVIILLILLIVIPVFDNVLEH